MSDEPTYEVGYKRPPRHTQFQKGQSGNPRGRPKGSLNLATVLDRTLRERVVINENGRRKTVTKLEAAVMQLVNKAAVGDNQSLKHLLSLVQLAESRLPEAGDTNSNTPMEATDQEIVRLLLKRVESAKPGGNDNAHGE